MKEWRDVVGYEGLYEVSHCGSIQSLDRTIECKNGVIKNLTGVILTPVVTGVRCLHITLCIDGSRRKVQIARVVWEAFSGCELPEQVRHKDGNGFNNDFGNLYAGGIS